MGSLESYQLTQLLPNCTSDIKQLLAGLESIQDFRVERRLWDTQIQEPE